MRIPFIAHRDRKRALVGHKYRTFYTGMILCLLLLNYRQNLKYLQVSNLFFSLFLYIIWLLVVVY